jgi:hypothetical protein
MPDSVILLRLLFSSNQLFNFPRLGGSSETRSGDSGDSPPPLERFLILMIAELFDEPLLVRVPELDSEGGKLPRGELVAIGNSGLLDRARYGSGLFDKARDFPRLIDRPRGDSRYGAVGDTGEGGAPSLLEGG